jgi:large subunit ribosomal protein L10
MSKYVKNLIAEHLHERLADVNDALLVNVVGMDVETSNRLRTELQAKDIELVVIKNSLAARATEGTALSSTIAEMTGSLAICWGSEDIVSVAKEIVRLAGDQQFAPFEARGGVIDGEPIDSKQVLAVSKWPSRTEQLSILLGQILSPAATLVGQLMSPANTLAGQLKERAENLEGEGGQEESGQ